MQDGGHDQPMPTARDVHPRRMISPLINRMGVLVYWRYTPSRWWDGTLFAGGSAPTVMRLHVIPSECAKQQPQDVSYEVLTTHHQETVCGTRILKAPAGPLAQPGLKLILSYGHLTKIVGSHPSTPDTASAVVHPTSYGTVGTDHRQGSDDALGVSGFGRGAMGAGSTQPAVRGLLG
jgi:hypothetical protein